MSVKAKYQAVLELGESLQIQNGNVEEVDGILKVSGTANTQYEKNLIWDKIKEAGGEMPSDIEADITVADETVFHRHTVVSGDTLGKIAKQYYGKAGEYHAIFKANTNILDNPDVIHPGQELIIPHLS
jgi:nucleoid-associated protein YgaU